MDYAAIDLHKTASQIRIISNGEIIDCRIPTTRDRLRTTFEGRDRMKILLEAATESEWVAQLLEALGHGRGGGRSELHADVRRAVAPREN
jgi:transposase